MGEETMHATDRYKGEEDYKNPSDERKTLHNKAESVVDIVRAHAREAEDIRHLPQAVSLAFVKQNLYRIGAPTVFGGEDASATSQMDVIETVSRADGAAGWNLMIGIETFALVAPSMSTCRDVIADPSVVMASSTAAVGKARQVAEGYVISGQWQFVSGIHNAHVFGATVQKYDTNDPISEERFYAILEKSQYEILDTWHVSGLRGSGSHDVLVSDVFVPENRLVATLGMGGIRTKQLLVPLGVRLTFNKTAVGFGIARSAIDAFIELARGKTPRFSNRKLKERPYAHRALALAEARLRGARAAMYEHATRVWSVCLANTELSDEDRAISHILASDAARAAVETVELLTEAAGTSANELGCPLEKLARDVRVIRQHATVQPHHMEDAGRLLLTQESRGILQM